MELKLKYRILLVFACLILIVVFSCLTITFELPSLVNARQLVRDGVRQAGHMFITESNGVPSTFTKTMSNGRNFLIQKGQLNKLRIRPCVINEHVESSREVQAMVDATTIVGQIIKLSHDNINCLSLTLESNEAAVIDDFESYADSAALQVEWVETDPTDPALLETTIVKNGTKSMNLPMSATLDDEWTNTVASTNYTGYTFSIYYRQSMTYTLGKMSFFIGDGTNTKSFSLVINDVDTWTHFEIDISAMSEDGGGTTNEATITKIGFRLDDAHPTGEAYLDDIEATPSPGSVDLELWDMGTTLPVASTDALDDGVQYTTLGDLGLNGGVTASTVNLTLQGGKRFYNIGFAAGVALEIPSNILLNENNYYALTINYVDTEVNVYGPDTSFSYQYYNNGYAFTTPDKSTAITAIGTYSDLMFVIYSTQDVYLTQYYQAIDAAPGSNANTNVFIEGPNMEITGILATNTRPIQFVSADLAFKPYIVLKGGKFEQYYNDDFADSVGTINMQVGYLYQPMNVNG
jgi:hypothetical protein